MDSDNLVQLVQKGFHITLGATSSLVESLGEPQRWEENISRLRTMEPNQLAAEWETKGANTEQEARRLLDTFLTQQMNRSDRFNDASTTAVTTVTTTATPTPPTDVQRDLQELTTQISALREELERLRNQNP